MLNSKLGLLFALAALHSEEMPPEMRPRMPRGKPESEKLTPEQQAIVDQFRARKIANKLKAHKPRDKK
jgi:uncharacterized iron-regulated protein